MTVSTDLKPFIKWAGGKQGLAETIVGFFPKSFRRYYEPFLGGGSVLLTMMAQEESLFGRGRGFAVVADANVWLVDTYHAVRDNWQDVLRLLDAMPNTREDFLRIRKRLVAEMTLEERAATFIYLNKTCFRGLFRVNQKGQFNVPYGAYDRRYYDRDSIHRVAEALQTVEFRCGDFELAVAGVTGQDFIYMDPPYYKLGGYADFNRYTATQFREADHERLGVLCRALDARGVRWAVSNSDTAFVRRLFEGFKLHKIEARREINLNAADRTVHELLITNY